MATVVPTRLSPTRLSPTRPDHASLATTQTSVEIRGLSRAFGGREVLTNLDLDVRPGEFVALLGRSGSGKSTLLRVLAGLDREATGEVRTPEPIAVAFQEPRLLPWKSVWRNVALGLTGTDVRRRAEQALAEVGLDQHTDAWPLTLSGGEAQRVSLARALVREPKLLLLDEPFGALDALTRLTAQSLVERLWERHRPAVLLVTHDVDEALLLADRVLVLDDGRISEDLTVDLPRPRARSRQQLDPLRDRLLASLGVTPVGEPTS
jgi:sulfonate transport system ATP-binding protein